MTTACECFGRNENCALCSGSGIISPKLEKRAIATNSKSYYSAGQSEQQKIIDALANEANITAAAAKPRKRMTIAEKDAAFEKRWKTEIDERVAWAESRRREEEELRELQEQIAQTAKVEEEKKERNEHIRMLRAEKEKVLPSILAKKRDSIAQGKSVSGPYRCMRCQWINESKGRACFLCNATDRYVEIS